MSRPRSEGEDSTLRGELLIEHARQLVLRASADAALAGIDYRRAVSAAYYGVFHYTVLRVAAAVVPEERYTARGAFCRMIDHSQLRKVAQWIDAPKSAPNAVAAIVEMVRDAPVVVAWAIAFRQLLDDRHLADYSHDVVFDRDSAANAVDQAHTVIDALQHSLADDDPSWLAVVSLVLIAAQGKDRS